jgi:hypothetical protein
MADSVSGTVHRLTRDVAMDPLQRAAATSAATNRSTAVSIWSNATTKCRNPTSSASPGSTYRRGCIRSQGAKAEYACGQLQG